MPISIDKHLTGCTKVNCIGGIHCVSHNLDKKSKEYRQANKEEKAEFEKCWDLDKQLNK